MNPLCRLALSALLSLTVAIGAAEAQSVGVTAAVNQTAHGTPPGGTMRTIVMGENIVHEERIATNNVGLVQLLFTDGTTLTVGPNSELVIESYLYDRNAGTAQLAASMSKGVLRFIGGLASKNSDGATIDTPIGTIGIRGGIADINLNPPSGIPPHVDMIFGKDVTLTRAGTLLERLYRSGYSIVVTPGGGLTVQKTPPGWSSQIQAALSGRPGTSGGASQQPTDQTVAESDVPESNSQGTTPPAPGNEPQPLTQSEVAELLAAVTTYDELRQFIVDNPPTKTFLGASGGIVRINNYDPSGAPNGERWVPLVTTGSSLPTAALTEISLDQNGKPVAGVIDITSPSDPYSTCFNCRLRISIGTSGTQVIATDAYGTYQSGGTGHLRPSSEIALAPGVNRCECAFLNWGAWDANVMFAEANGSTIATAGSGHWVVADITSSQAIADLQAQDTGTIATYSGFAVGTVSAASGPAYTASGNMNMNWSFGTRSGNIEIMDFDVDHSFYGTINDSAAPATAFFGGLVTGGAGGGTVRGAFVNDGATPAAGVAGDFLLRDGTWNASGIFAGERGLDAH